MAVSMRQGLSSTQAVIGVYDPVPVVLYDTDVSTLFNYRYVIQVNKRVGTNWVQVAKLKRIPNQESAGAFDLSQLLRGTLQVDDPETSPVNPSNNPASFANNAAFFQIKCGRESATTQGGTITETLNATFYTLAVAAQFGTEFDTWPYSISDRFLPKVGGGGKFLTERTTRRIEFGGQRYDAHVVPVPFRDFHFAVSMLFTDNQAPWNTDTQNVRVRIGNRSTIFASADTNLLAGQSVSNTSYSGMNLGNGGCPRQLHIGYGDLADQSWASNVQGNSTWTHMYVEVKTASGGFRYMKPWVFTIEDDCTHNGMHFKFLNKFGGYDYVFCKGHTSSQIDYTRQNYNTSTANYYTANGLADALLQVNDPDKRQTISQVTQEKRKHKAYTGYIDDTDNELVVALLGSQRVYATKFVAPREQQDDSAYFPVVITNSSVKRMYQETDKMVEYTIEFEYANTPRPRI